MILELDCGNSFLKWRVIAGERVERSGVAETLEEIRRQLDGLQLKAGRLVSVRTDEETAAMRSGVEAAWQIPVAVAASSELLARVRNGYREPQRLGLDRWLALVAAYQLASSACLVVDLGTAVTIDYVAADGEHLGGFICPGLPLMRSQLTQQTRRVRYQVTEMADLLSPGRSTAEAVERGCLQMLRAFISEQLAMGRERLGADCTIFLTGGDASLVADLAPQARYEPDLVFRGLALACPL